LTFAEIALCGYRHCVFFYCKVFCVRDDGLTSYLGFADSVLLLQLLWKKIVLIRRDRRVGLGTTARYLYYCLLSSVYSCTSLDLRRTEWIFWPAACEPGWRMFGRLLFVLLN